MNIRYVPLVLLFSLVASSIEMDISVPGFPGMAEFFATSEANIQSTLSMNFLGFCIASLFFGPLADSFGRKKLMVAGFLLFGLCSTGCAITDNLSNLLAYRFFQGLGASSVWVIAYAIIADLYQGKLAAKYIGLTNAVATAVMAIAPAFGSLLCKTWGWRSTYTVVSFLSVASLIAITFWLPETIQQKRPFKLKLVLADYYKLLSSYDYMLHAFVPSIISAAYMAYIAAAPFLYIDKLHMSFDEYAVHQSLVIAGFSIVSFKVDWFLEKFGELRSQKLGLWCCIGSMLAIAPLSYLFPTNAIFISACMMVYGFGAAIIFGVLVAKTLGFYPELKGTASSLMMAMRVSFCSLGVWIGAQFYTGNLFDSTIVVSALASIGIMANMLTFKYSYAQDLNQQVLK